MNNTSNELNEQHVMPMNDSTVETTAIDIQRMNRERVINELIK